MWGATGLPAGLGKVTSGLSPEQGEPECLLWTPSDPWSKPTSGVAVCSEPPAQSRCRPWPQAHGGWQPLFPLSPRPQGLSSSSFGQAWGLHPPGVGGLTAEGAHHPEGSGREGPQMGWAHANTPTGKWGGPLSRAPSMSPDRINCSRSHCLMGAGIQSGLPLEQGAEGLAEVRLVSGAPAQTKCRSTFSSLL